ncbi:hypothetical protein [Bradyrhizobium sp. STM 3809]|uniref:hypothetical protein n=1 Tax=Bradyrhizobium sp. STM 3809 TaxID=551936 RepID=UPI0002409D47|nr:hypothetical protein [Bradyrhizobium sp. STM 3809]CCE01798.1 conserved exported hypothetical protein [Bradyrhizobium sp. STM 3809]
MRALCLGALAFVSALALAGCSRPVMPQVAAPCVDLSGQSCAETPAVGQPASLAPSEPAKASRKAHAVARRAALHRKHVRAAKRRAASSVAAAKPVEKPVEKLVEKPVEKPQRAARPDPIPPADGASAPVAKPPSAAKDSPAQNAPAKDGAAKDTSANSAKVQGEVMVAAVKVAAELAERMTALRVPEGPGDSPLVAVLLARPNVRALGDLSGKVIAIDERYAKSNARITAAMNAAGASEVLLLEGQATAITRLSSGEVSAAVVALASPEAAEAFPKIAGFRLFSIALKP